MTKLHRLQRFRMTQFRRLRRFRVTKLQIACGDGLLANSFSRLTTRIENSKSIALMDKSSYSLLRASWTLLTIPTLLSAVHIVDRVNLKKSLARPSKTVFFTHPNLPNDFRFPTKSDTLYAFALGWRSGGPHYSAVGIAELLCRTNKKVGCWVG